MTLLAMALKPLIGGLLILSYKYLLYLIEKYLPRWLSEFLLKKR